MYSFGIDIGGKTIKLGLVNEKGKILTKEVFDTAKTAEENIFIIAINVKKILSDCKISLKNLRGIGIGCPGSVSTSLGVIDYLPNLGWENVPIVNMLKKYFNSKIVIANDANVAILAEAKYGVAKDVNNSIMFTLGTGVGGGIIIDKKLYLGLDSKGAELGHTTLILDGKPCSCGRKGCVESYVSAQALINQTIEAMINNKNTIMWEMVNGELNKVTGITAFNAAKLNDIVAINVVNNYIKYLAESMMNMFNIFRPDLFVLGGGISNEGDYLINLLENYLEKYNYGYKGAPKPLIKIAKFKNDAGIIGASALV